MDCPEAILISSMNQEVRKSDSCDPFALNNPIEINQLFFKKLSLKLLSSNNRRKICSPMLIHRVKYLDSKIKDYVKLKPIHFPNQVTNSIQNETLFSNITSPSN